MHREGHVGAALLAYAPLGFAALALGADQVALAGAVAAAGGAMLPDVDVRLPLVPHRGPTHTVWFALVVGVAGAIGGGLVGWETGPLAAAGTAGFGFLVGAAIVGSHVAADALTPAGVAPFHPLVGTRYSVGVARAANPVANYLLLAVGVAAAALALAAGSAAQTI